MSFRINTVTSILGVTVAWCLLDTALATCNYGKTPIGSEYTSGTKWVLCEAPGKTKTLGCVMPDKKQIKIGQSSTVGSIQYTCESKYNGAYVSLTKKSLSSSGASSSSSSSSSRLSPPRTSTSARKVTAPKPTTVHRTQPRTTSNFGSSGSSSRYPSTSSSRTVPNRGSTSSRYPSSTAGKTSLTAGRYGSVGSSSRYPSPTSNTARTSGSRSSSTTRSSFGSTKPSPAPSRSSFGSAKSNPAPSRSSFGSAKSNPAPSRSSFGSAKSNPAPSRSSFGSAKSNPAPSRSSFGSAKSNPAPSRSSFGSSRSNPSPSGSRFGSSKSSPGTIAELGVEVEADDEIDCTRNGKSYHEGASVVDRNVKYTCLHGKGMQPTACISSKDRSEIKVGGVSNKCGRTQRCSSTGVLSETYDRSKDTCQSASRVPAAKPKPAPAPAPAPRKSGGADIGKAITNFFQGCTDSAGKPVPDGGKWKDRTALHECKHGKKHIIGCVSPKGVEVPLGEERVLDDEFIGTCRLDGTKLIFGLKLNS